MSPFRTRDVAMLVMSAVVMVIECSAMRVDLAELFGHRNMPSEKRVVGGNPCQMPDQPWPCQSGKTCIPMSYICDENYDCEDGSDEDEEMCTAKSRPPVEDIVSFLESQQNWIIPELFDNRNIYKVAHGLAVSQSVDAFRKRLGLSSREIKPLENALKYIKNGDEEKMERYGMPKSAWSEVNFFFARLLKAGFA